MTTSPDPTVLAFDNYESPDDVKTAGFFTPPAPMTVNCEILSLQSGVRETLGDKKNVPFVRFIYRIADGEHAGQKVGGSDTFFDSAPPRDEKVAAARNRSLGNLKANCAAVLGSPIPSGMTWTEIVNAASDRINEANEAGSPLLAAVRLAPGKPRGKTGFVPTYDDIKRLLSS